MNDVIALGELLIDFTEVGITSKGMRLFERNPGGAPANVLTALARLGKRTGFIGKVGMDMHGLFLKQTLEEIGIDTAALQVDDTVFTTMAFVTLGQNGERQFSFARKPGADTCLRPDEVDPDYFRGVKIFHLGSLSLTDQPARDASLTAIKWAKEAGAIISYDPNYRAPLWKEQAEAVEQMRSVLPYVDIMKLSDEETTLLTGKVTPEKALDVLLQSGVKIAVVTLGADGSIVGVAHEKQVVPGCRVNAVDTTGAGDAFFGGFLNELLDQGLDSRQWLERVTLDGVVQAARVGNAVAGLCVERHGAIPAMPTREEVLCRLQMIPVVQG